MLSVLHLMKYCTWKRELEVQSFPLGGNDVELLFLSHTD